MFVRTKIEDVGHHAEHNERTIEPPSAWIEGFYNSQWPQALPSDPLQRTDNGDRGSYEKITINQHLIL